MHSLLRRLAAGAFAALGAVAASAQCPTGIVGFNGPPIDDPNGAFEMFRIPQVSGTTSAYIVANSSGNNANSTYRASGFQTEGDAGLETYFDWVDPANRDSWVRLTTFGGALRPNPALHTQGKVRFRIKNLGNFINGRIGLCLGIRESGLAVPQLADGGTTGPIEWVGVSTTPSVITPGPDGVLDSTPLGDDELRTLTIGSAIVAGLDGVLDSVAANDDVVGAGFTYSNANPAAPLPIPALTLNVSASPVDLEWDLASGVVSVNGTPSGGGVAPFTGDGILNAPNNRGTLEHLAITVADGSHIRFMIDELQFEAPESDPLTPPVVATPIIAGDTTIHVSSINACVDQVNLLLNHVVVQTLPAAANTPVDFTIPAATAGDVYTATQRDSVSGQVGPESLPVTVTSGPPSYGISVVLDEDGNGSCSPAGPWEFLGADSLITRPDSDLFPNGTPIFTNSAVWQTIEFDLTNDALVTAWLGGNGHVDPSPIGLYTFDSLWFNEGAAGVGPHEVFIDAIEVLDAGDNVLQVIHSFEDGRNFLSNTRGQSTVVAPTVTQLSTAASYDGRTSRRLVWTYPATDTQQSLGQLFREGASCGATTHVQFTDQGTKIRLHIIARGAPVNALALPLVNGPIVQGTPTIRIQNDATATSTQLYVNGVAVGAAQPPVAGFTDFAGVSVAAGDSVSAKQVIGGVESDFAYPRAVLADPIPPAVPTIQAPIEDGDGEVNLAGVTADTTLLEILDGGSTVIGSLAVSNPAANVAVPISGGLHHLQSVTVRASNAAGSNESPAAAALEVGIGNGDVYVCIGVRENNDPGPLGSPATVGSAAAIEWIGATATVGGSPIGRSLVPLDTWTTLTFDPAIDPILGFTGNGVIDVARGTLEHLALTMNSTSPNRSSGQYEIFIDNVWNLNADGGPDFLLSDFESFAVGDEVLFQEPTFSGSTAGNMTPLPSSSSVSDLEGNPGQSVRLVCFFKDTAAGRWARITTSSSVNPLHNPIIDILHPVRFDILIRPSAPPANPGDVDGDGDVDLTDLALLLSSFGLCDGAPGYQAGADFDGSGCIELADLATLLSNYGS